MKIVSISDVHNGFQHISIPKADVLTISGDITWSHKIDYKRQKHQIEDIFIPWCKDLLEREIVKHIVFIAGNHDEYLYRLYKDNEEVLFRAKLPYNIHYLRDSSVEIDGVKFYGSPWTPEFCGWYFMKNDNAELEADFAKIPEDVDILLCHGPAYGIGDCIGGHRDPWEPEKLGSQALLKHLRRVRPQWLLVGHIHSGEHKPIVHLYENQRVQCVNVSLASEEYNMIYKPFEFEINKSSNK